MTTKAWTAWFRVAGEVGNALFPPPQERTRSYYTGLAERWSSAAGAATARMDMVRVSLYTDGVSLAREAARST